MPIGLTSAPDIYMHNMNNLFSNVLDSGKVAFLDNIVMYSCIVKEHFMLLEKILAYLHQYICYCKLKNFGFLCSSTMFLCFDITPEGVQISDSMI